MEETEARNRPQAERRVIRIVAGENDGEAAYALARANGFNPDDERSNDLIVLRNIVTPKGQEPWKGEPYVMAQSGAPIDQECQLVTVNPIV